MLYRIALGLITVFLASTCGASDPLVQHEADLQRFAAFISSNNIINLPGQDVHQFNIKIKPFAQVITRCNGALKLDRNADLNQILSGIIDMRKKYGIDPSYDQEILRLGAYLAKGLDYDKETDMHISHLLTAIWNYLSWNQYLESSHNLKTEAVLSELLFYLQQNTVEKGGCFPGYAGRLMLLNGRFILEFQNTINICPTLFNELLVEWSNEKGSLKPAA